jgi:hypothetical protein
MPCSLGTDGYLLTGYRGQVLVVVVEALQGAVAYIEQSHELAKRNLCGANCLPPTPSEVYCT